MTPLSSPCDTGSSGYSHLSLNVKEAKAAVAAYKDMLDEAKDALDAFKEQTQASKEAVDNLAKEIKDLDGVIRKLKQDGYPVSRDLIAAQDTGFRFTAFNQADKLVVTDIYAAGEKPIEGVSAKALFDGIKSRGHKDAVYIPDMDGVVDWLAANVEKDDIVITLGAGDVWKAGEALLKRLRKDVA